MVPKPVIEPKPLPKPVERPDPKVLEKELQSVQKVVSDDRAALADINKEIADLEQQSAHQRADIVKRLGVQNSATARRKQLLNQAYNQQLGVVSDQSVKEVRYNILKKEVDANRDIYQSMLQRVKEASIVAALRSSDVRVVSPGSVPTSPYRPKTVRLRARSPSPVWICAPWQRTRRNSRSSRIFR